LLKSFRNAVALTYSHWGGTDHEGLRDPHQRRGLVLQFVKHDSPEKPPAPKTRSHAVAAIAFLLKQSSLMTCHGRLFLFADRGPSEDEEGGTKLKAES